MDYLPRMVLSHVEGELGRLAGRVDSPPLELVTNGASATAIMLLGVAWICLQPPNSGLPPDRSVAAEGRGFSAFTDTLHTSKRRGRATGDNEGRFYMGRRRRKQGNESLRF